MPQSTSDLLSARIHAIRGQRVILDSDLARLYGVPTFRFNEAVKRNAEKFPEDFRFQLTPEEFANLKSQSAISSVDTAGLEGVKGISSQSAMRSKRGAGYRPWAFNEHGCLMAATVLNSPRAVQMSLYVIRAFVQMREALASNQAVLRRLAEIDKTLLEHDAALRALWDKLRPLLTPPPEPLAKEMGFHVGIGKQKRGR
ncbi:MAG: ORF6N domain-containing protein [Opitutae bacterium]|nr:ORF6N domain-containing protein [Opitutae bacterium]